MRTVFSILFLAALSSASPVRQQKRGASVIPIRPRDSLITDGLFDIAKANRDRARAYTKYKDGKFTAPSASSRKTRSTSVIGNVVRGDSPGVEPLNDDYEEGMDVMYWGGMQAGTPSDLWLPLTTCGNCSDPKFDSGASSTYSDTGNAFSIQYGDGSTATGTVATDTVTVAGLTVEKQGFGAVTDATGNFRGGKSAGLMGMAFPDLATSGETPFFINLVQQGKLAMPLFSFYLSRGPVSSAELCIGCINKNKFQGEITHYPVLVEYTALELAWWLIESDGISYGGKQLLPKPFGAVIDSGTTLFYGPTPWITLFYLAIPGSMPADVDAMNTDYQGYWTYPCNTNLEEIALVLGGEGYPLNIEDFNIGILSDDKPDRCVGGIAGMDLPGSPDVGIVGDLWMKSWYSVFTYNVENPNASTVGFAKAV